MNKKASTKNNKIIKIIIKTNKPIPKQTKTKSETNSKTETKSKSKQIQHSVHGLSIIHGGVGSGFLSSVGRSSSSFDSPEGWC
jgi:hypothetical protein